MSVSLDLKGTEGYFTFPLYEKKCEQAFEISKQILSDPDADQVLGWRTLEQSAVQLDVMKEKAKEIRENADV